MQKENKEIGNEKMLTNNKNIICIASMVVVRSYKHTHTNTHIHASIFLYCIYHAITLIDVILHMYIYVTDVTITYHV